MAERDFFEGISGKKLPKPRAEVPVGSRKIALGAAPGSMPLPSAMLLGGLGYFLMQWLLFKAPLGDPATVGFSVFIALSFAFIIVALLGVQLYKMHPAAQAIILGAVIAFGIKYGVSFLKLVGAPITAQPLSTLSLTPSVQFLVNGVDYTIFFWALIALILYYTADDWWSWIHGRL